MTANRCDTIQSELTFELVHRGLVPPDATWQPLAGGRTNLSWQVTHADVSQVVKLYAAAGQNVLFPNEPAQEAAVLGHLNGHNLAPEPGFSGETAQGAVLIYTHIEGANWTSDTAQVAQLLYLVHSLPPLKGLRTTPNGSAALTRQALEILNKCRSPEATKLARMCPKGDVPPSNQCALLHGDPVPGNIIASPEGLRLIDWQCPAQGDPCEDIALFISPAMQMAYRGLALKPVEVESFLNAYPDAEVVQRYRDMALWYHFRMAAYCLWKQENRHDQGSIFTRVESDYLVAEKQFLS